jgi:hypothetical protein
MTFCYNNLVYNNNFTTNANYPAIDMSGGSNDWNISKTPGINIIFGPNLGGNFYSDYPTTDNDNDGIGDTNTPYGVPGSSFSSDYLPLTNNKSISLIICDELDDVIDPLGARDCPYGGQTKGTGDQIFFFGNYSNSTNPLNESDCNISFDTAPTGPFSMYFNNTKQLKEYNRTFSSSGLVDWNVTCNQTGYTTLTETDDIDIKLNTNLVIWDATDIGMPYAGQTKYVNEDVNFFGNYTKQSDGTPLNLSDCNISFSVAPVGPVAMTFNNTIDLFEYDRSFSSSGTYNWYINCTFVGSDYLPRDESDSIFINPTPTNGGGGGGGITEEETVEAEPIILPPQVISDGDEEYNEEKELSAEEARQTIPTNKEIMNYVDVTTSLPSRDIKEARLKFRVPNSFLLSQRINPASTSAINYVEGQVGNLPAEYIESDNTFSYYLVKSEHLSGFALVGDKVPRTIINFIPVQISLIVLAASLIAGLALFIKPKIPKKKRIAHKLPRAIHRPPEIKPQKVPRELDHYISHCIKLKIPPAKVKKDLINMGWERELIDHVLRIKKYT